MNIIDWDALEGKHPEEEIQRICAIDTTDLEETLRDHASVYAYCSAAHEVAKYEVAKAKWKIEQTEAKVFQEMKENDPKMAVSAIKAVIENHKEVKQANAVYLNNSKKASLLGSLVYALQHRKDMLIQIASRQREELRSQI